MARFGCERYPSLVVMSGSVVVARFRDGVCDTADPAAVEALARAENVRSLNEPEGAARRRKVTRS